MKTNFKTWVVEGFNRLMNFTDISRKVDVLMAQQEHMIKSMHEHHSGYVDKGTQILLSFKYRELFKRGIMLPFEEVEFRNHSQNGEDGILWNIFSLIGTTNKKTVEICAGNGKECNSANLIINHGWHGLLVEGDRQKAEYAKEYYFKHPDTYLIPPVVLNEWVTAENINDFLREYNFVNEVDLLSIDVDGIDYWLWNAIDVISPRVVMVEIQSVWRCTASVTVPYRPDFKFISLQDPRYGLAWFAGASLPAFVKLARKKGYRLIGANRHAFNVIFMHNDVGVGIFPEVEPESVFKNEVSNQIYDRARPLYDGLDWQEI